MIRDGTIGPSMVEDINNALESIYLEEGELKTSLKERLLQEEMIKPKVPWEIIYRTCSSTCQIAH